MLSFEGAWEEKNLEIETSVEEEVFVDTDGQLLSLVWNNLFSNAIKFTEDNGKITRFVEGMSDIKNLTSFPKSLTVKSQLHTRFPIMRKR